MPAHATAATAAVAAARATRLTAPDLSWTLPQLQTGSGAPGRTRPAMSNPQTATIPRIACSEEPASWKARRQECPSSRKGQVAIDSLGPLPPKRRWVPGTDCSHGGSLFLAGSSLLAIAAEAGNTP